MTNKKYKILEVDPKFRLSYTIPVDEHGVHRAVQFAGFFDHTFLLGTKNGWNEWSLDQISFDHPYAGSYGVEDRRRMTEFIVAADNMDQVRIDQGSTFYAPSEYNNLACDWGSKLAQGNNRKVEVDVYRTGEFILKFPIFLKSAFQTIHQIKQMLSDAIVIVPRLTPEVLKCLATISDSKGTLIWFEKQNIRALKRFLFLFEPFQREFEMLMSISSQQIIGMTDFINEWLDFFRLIKAGSSRTIGCVTIVNRAKESLGSKITFSIAGLRDTHISLDFKNPLPSSSLYVNVTLRFLLMVIACIKFSEKGGTFISRVTRETLTRS